MVSLSPSFLAHDYCVAPIFCGSPMTDEWRGVFLAGDDSAKRPNRSFLTWTAQWNFVRRIKE